MIKIEDKEYELELIKREYTPWSGPCGGEIVTYYYKCPICGEGMYIHVNEDTPGDRDHYSYLDCKNCDPDKLIYTNPLGNSWDLIKRTPEEIEKVKKYRMHW